VNCPSLEQGGRRPQAGGRNVAGKTRAVESSLDLIVHIRRGGNDDFAMRDLVQ
jgi:hypothetical protein